MTARFPFSDAALWEIDTRLPVAANIGSLGISPKTDTPDVYFASSNGVSRRKHTVGMELRRANIPGTKHPDNLGSFGRMAADAVHGLNRIMGHDSNDQRTDLVSGSEEDIYSQSLKMQEAMLGEKYRLLRKPC